MINERQSMINPRLLLIYPSFLYAPTYGKKEILKTHLVHLFSFLRNHNIEVDVLDLENEIGRPETDNDVKKFNETSKKLISRYDFDIVAISCWSSLNYLSSIMVGDICRDINSQCIITVGGYHPSAVPSDFLYESSPFDFIVIGEGEEALLDIIRGNLKRKKTPRIIQGSPMNLKKGVPLYWQEYPYREHQSSNIIYLSRGCPYSCAYCMEQSKGSRGWRRYTVDQSIEVLQSLIESLDPKQIKIMDPCFGFDSKWRKKFLMELCRCRIEKLLWAETRMGLIDKEDIDLLSQLNFVIAFGIESCSKKMLRIMNKTPNPEKYLRQFEETLSYLNEKEVPYQAGFMFNHPGETPETFRESIMFLRTFVNGQKKMSGFILANKYAFFPGSDIHMNLKYYDENFGTVVKHKEWWKKKMDHRELATAVAASHATKQTFGDKVDYWRHEIVEINTRIYEKMSRKTRIFWYAKMLSEKDKRFIVKKSCN
jgi:radical SAM superfamily enzyme YgiQ (UPF0313 family)